MTVSLLPYGKLADGKYGIRVADGTNIPLASVIEIEQFLPSVSNPDNFAGRLIFEITRQTTYVYRTAPSPHWQPLDGLPVTVKSESPPDTPTPSTGELFYNKLSQVLYLYDGLQWVETGGRYAVSVGETISGGDGVTTIFPTGAANGLPIQLIEVFLDGVRQTPAIDYVSLGNNVQFVTAPPNGTKVFVRAFISGPIAENAQTYAFSYTGNGTNKDFDTGVSGSGSTNIMVFRNGLLQRIGVDYTLISQNTEIDSISRTGTSATMVCVAPHGMGIGSVFSINGAMESSWNTSFTVASVPGASTVTFTVSTSFPTSATPDPTLYFSPPTQNDIVRFNSAPTNGDIIDVRTIKSAVAAPAQGEANTVSSVGTGFSWYLDKNGVDLRFKTIIPGTNLSIVDQGTALRINANSYEYESNRVEVSQTSYQVGLTDSYVAVMSTVAPVVIDLSTIPVSSTQKGRRLLIGDESGGASVNTITITTGGTAQINGSVSPITINTDYGYARLSHTGTGWVIRGRA